MQEPKRQYLSEYKMPDFQIENVSLYFNLYETQTRVKSAIKFLKKSTTSSLMLNGENLKLISLFLDKKQLIENTDFTISNDSLTILQTPSQFTLECEVEINPSENKSCEGLYLSQRIFCTQCEAESFRKITYFLDRPDVMTSYTVQIEADEKKYPHLLSNGDCIEKKSLGNGRHLAKWQDPFKKPSYLFALVAGDMGVIEDTFTTSSGKKVKLEVYAPHGKQNRCYHAMESLKKSMKWDQDRFGLEYDLNQYMIVSIDDFNMGAMENKGLNVFNSRLVLADERSATDHDFHMIESVVGHEYFHNWTGNRVTCRNWFELSLKEGLTVFRDQEFSADLNSRAVQRIKDVDSLRTRQFSEDAGPNAHPVRPESCLAVDNFYTATIYEKGAELIRMLQTLVGIEGFNLGMKEYFKRHDGQAVTIIDFVDAIAAPNKIDLTQFKLWYSQAGTPEVTVKEEYNETQKTYTLHLTQNCDLTFQEKNENKIKRPFHIPLKMGLLNQLGQELKEHNQVLNFTKEEQSFTFSNIEEKPILSLNRDFSAPVKIKWNRSSEDLLQLIKFDTDSFNRRESCSKMMFDEVRRLIQCYQQKTDLVPSTNIINALGYIIEDDQLDLEFKTLLLQMPATEQIVQEEEILDAKAFFMAKQSLMHALTKKYELKLNEIYKQNESVNSIGSRAIKNLALSYLTLTFTDKYLDKVINQFDHATCMTDKLAALDILSQFDLNETQSKLKHFQQEWHQDSVVFNKWLAVQSTSISDKTYQRVIEATQTQGFDSKNPNNLYSLHVAFAKNYLRFYEIQNKKNNLTSVEWYAKELVQIDQVNPQVGARLASVFNFTKKLPSDIRQHVTQQILWILEQPSLSKNARELLERQI